MGIVCRCFASSIQPVRTGSFATILTKVGKSQTTMDHTASIFFITIKILIHCERDPNLAVLCVSGIHCKWVAGTFCPSLLAFVPWFCFLIQTYNFWKNLICGWVGGGGGCRICVALHLEATFGQSVGCDLRHHVGGNCHGRGHPIV